MYHLSRSIYRELAPDILEDERHCGGPSNHERVLRSCEQCVERLATDWHYFARPTKTLFNDIRIYFPMSAQLRVYKTVHFYLCDYVSGSTDDHDHEVENARWMPLEDARTALSYPGERALIERALSKSTPGR